MSALGDPHNFGRCVRARGGRIEKPRTVLWEWLLLCAKSPLRRALAGAALRDPIGPAALHFLPDLAFSGVQGPVGVAERIELRPLPRPSATVRAELSTATGHAIAFFSWFGVSDLHWENLALGLDGERRTVFTPLDVEMILGDFALPTETNLLPDADPDYAETYRHAAGVRRVLPYLGKPVKAADVVRIAAAYRAMLGFLGRHRSEIAAVLRTLPLLRKAPIRVSLRGTDEYVRARSEPVFPPLLTSESEQLARGDVPYFFREYGRPGIRYYTTPSLSKVGSIPLRGDVPKLPPLLSVERRLRSPNREKLRNEGLLALLAAFDDPSLDGTHASPSLSVRFGPRSLLVRLPDGEELRAPRNLRRFVGSVYLPCRCGEVKTVRVPAVTRCLAEGERPLRRRRAYSPPKS